MRKWWRVVLGGRTCSFPCNGADELATFVRCQWDRLEKFSVAGEAGHFQSWPSEPAVVLLTLCLSSARILRWLHEWWRMLQLLSWRHTICYVILVLQCYDAVGSYHSRNRLWNNDYNVSSGTLNPIIPYLMCHSPLHGCCYVQIELK